MRILIPIATTVAIALSCIQAHALMMPQKIEIDGKLMSTDATWDLLENRGSQFVIADFKTVKINGVEAIPYNMKPGEVIFVRTMSEDGDSTSYESKLKSARKFGFACKSQGMAVPAGVQPKGAVSLSSGQAAFAWLLKDDKDAQPYMTNGQSKMVFVCDPNNSNGAKKTLGARSTSVGSKSAT